MQKGQGEERERGPGEVDSKPGTLERWCTWVGDGRGLATEQIWEDERWCASVADLITYR